MPSYVHQFTCLSSSSPAIGRPVKVKKPRIGAHRGLSGWSTPKRAFLLANSKMLPTCTKAQRKCDGRGGRAGFRAKSRVRMSKNLAKNGNNSFELVGRSPAKNRRKMWTKMGIARS